MKLLLATQNKHKVIELKQLLKDYPQFKVISLNEISIRDDVEETGITFEENARLKALYFYRLTQIPCIADDSGLEIKALNNEPGIYSARYLGEDTSYTIKNQVILDRLQNEENRDARFISVVCLVLNEDQVYSFEGIMPGTIGYEAKGSNGFGYDPIFIPKGYTQSYSEMDLEIKNQLSHRGQALRKATDFLEKSAL